MRTGIHIVDTDRGYAEAVRIIYSGSVVSNGGDAAIMQAQMRALADALPDVEAIILDQRPDVSARIFPDVENRHSILPFHLRLKGRQIGDVIRWAYRRRLLRAAGQVAAGRRPRALLPVERRAIDLIASADLIAYTGGTTLIEKYVVQPKLIELEVAAAMGKPTVLLPQSLGPFPTPKVADRMRKVINAAKKVLLRDPRSRDHVSQIGADMTEVEVVPDIVFALMRDDAPQRVRDGAMPDAPRVLISARNVIQFSEDGPQGQVRYNASMVDLVTHLVRDLDASVTFASTCQGVPTYRHDDSADALNVVEQLPADVRAAVTLNRDFHTPDQLHDLYAGFDLAIVTRLHAGIMALNVGVPTVGIAYEFKTHEVMGSLGIGEYVVDIEELGGDVLTKRVDRFVDDLPALRPALADSLDLMRHEGKLAGQKIAEALLDQTKRP